MEDAAGFWIIAAYGPLLLVVAWAAFQGAKSSKDEPPTPLFTDPETLIERLGATEVDRGFGRITAQGSNDGRSYDVEFNANEGAWMARIGLVLPLPQGVRIKEEGFFSKEDLEIGDERFDSVVHLTGSPAWQSAAFGPQARRTLLEIQSSGSYELEGGALRTSASLHGDGDDLIRAISAATRLANLLDVAPEDIPQRLFDHADGTDRASRIAALRLLAYFPEDPLAKRLAVGAPANAAPLAALVLDQPDAEAGLLPSLAHRDPEVRHAAAVLLGQRGTIDSVQALRDAATGRVKEAALEAVSSIQKRAGDVSAGGLAVVQEADGGELALSAAQKGQVALKN